MAQVNIISGFLGAGKTTFIKELLSKVFNGHKVVLIENEFGEIGIDGGFLKQAGVEITEMNSGCICCSLVGDFSEALLKVEEQFHPEYILIEPSGVGKLSDVAKAVLDAPADAHIELAGGITIVDAKKAKKYLANFGEFFKNQVEYADTVVLSRTGDISEEALSECLEIIRTLNPGAAIITTPWNELSGEALISALNGKNSSDELIEKMLEEAKHHHHHHHHHHDGEECDDPDCCCHHHHDEDEDDDDDDECEEHEHHHHHDHDADEVFTSWGRETVHKYSYEALSELLDKLANTNEYGVILRSKGMVALDDGRWCEFDLVPAEKELRIANPDYTGKICVIGTELDEVKLAAAFALKE